MAEGSQEYFTGLTPVDDAWIIFNTDMATKQIGAFIVPAHGILRLLSSGWDG